MEVGIDVSASRKRISRKRMYTDKISGILTRKELCTDAIDAWSRTERQSTDGGRNVTVLDNAPMTARFTAFMLTQRWSRQGQARLN